MTIGKNEKRLLLFLGFVVYAFAFYKFVWVPVIPGIREVNAKIHAAEAERTALDHDLANMDQKKAELEAMKTSNERIGEYLMSSGNLVDSLDFINKLGRFLERGVTEMSISKPEERGILESKDRIKTGTDDSTVSSSQNGTYYEIRVDFKANMPYNTALNLIKFLEGGTRKVKISRFIVKPLKDEKTAAGLEQEGNSQNGQGASQTQQGNQGQKGQARQQGNQGTQKTEAGMGEQVFEINMSVCLYSLNLRASDRMYEYSRHKLGRYIENGGIFLSPEASAPQDAGASGQGVSAANQAANASILVKGMSYLTGGENLQVFGTNRNSEILRLTSNKHTNLNVNFIGTNYTVSTYDGGGNPLSIKGQLLPGDISVHVDVDMPNIKENENIRYFIKISNNTGRKVHVSLNDKQKRAKILDRYNKEINGNSTREKVNIL